MINVFIIDRYPVVRSGVALILARDSGIRVCGEAEEAVKALPQIEELHPEVVIVDVFKNGTGGTGAIEELTKRCPEVKVIVLTESSREVDFLKAVRAGAKGYLAMSVRPEDIINAIRLAAAGGTVFHCRIGSKLFGGLGGPEGQRDKGELSSREKQILAMVSVGSSNKEIADSIYVCETTVKSYVSRILHKLGVKNRAQAVAIAIEQGILDLYPAERTAQAQGAEKSRGFNQKAF